MAEVVAAAATSHILMSPAGAEAPADNVFQGMLRIGRHVQDARPDLLVVISNDHMFNVGPGETAPFLLACAERFVPFGEMDIPRVTYSGDPVFADGLLEYAQSRGVEIRRLDSFAPDHGTAVPLLFANPEREVPVVPLLVNYDRDPPPSPREAWQLGEVLGSFIRARPAEERVAIVAAGGLSHWVGYEETPINEAFDRAFLEALEQSRLDGWRNKAADEIRHQAGNGGLEVMSWLMMAAAVPDAHAEVVYYQPMPSWMTGMGGVIMKRSAR